MEETMVAKKWKFGCFDRKMSAEVRLLYAACYFFIMAQYVADEHPWNSGFRILALLAMIAALWIGARTRRA